jgi:hypothetical protein
MEGIDLNVFFDVAVYWLIGIVALVVAYNFWKGEKKIIENGIETEGIVFDMVTRSGAYGGADHPVIRFLTSDDVWITETYDIGSSITFLKRCHLQSGESKGVHIKGRQKVKLETDSIAGISSGYLFPDFWFD